MNNKIMLVDRRTGEVLEDNILLIGKNPYFKKKDKGYIKIFVAFLKDIVEDKEIAGKAIRLLFYMLENMDYENYEITIIPSYAQEDLGISKKTYYQWIKALINKGIITKIDTYTYHLNPYVAVKGDRGKALENTQENLKRKKRICQEIRRSYQTKSTSYQKL